METVEGCCLVGEKVHWCGMFPPLCRSFGEMFIMWRFHNEPRLPVGAVFVRSLSAYLADLFRESV